MTAPPPDPAENDPEIAAKLRLATGGAAPTQAWRMLQELADASGACAGVGDGGDDTGGAAGEARVVAALEAAMALAPRDPLEGMLAVQMAAVHAAALRCLARAAACADHPQIEARYLREAARLLNLFVRQAEALDRRARRFGREDGSRHAPRGAEPMPTAAQGPGEAGCDPADGAEPADGEPEQDGAEILRTLIADIYARRGEVQDTAGERAGPPHSAPGPRGGPAP